MDNKKTTPVLTPAAISQKIWAQKYKHSNDKAITDTWQRLASASAAVKVPKFLANSQEKLEDKYFSMLTEMRFIPGGRIISNLGTTKKKVTCMNCYVLPLADDSMAAIFSMLQESALTQKMGGGVGFCFDKLRPRGSAVKGVESSASGPVSFMHVFDAACKSIVSAGERRGAQLSLLSVWHPDIEEFIDAKRTKGALRHFNLSVGITKEFMEAVRNNKPWDLVFNGKVHKTVKAVDLWDKIMKSTYTYAEPGVLFIDTINEYNNLRYCEVIETTNPCFAPGTLIATRYGKGAVPIEELVGKSVEVFDGENWITTDTFRVTGHNQRMLKISLQNKLTVTTTEYHTFVLSDKSRVTAVNLKKGDKLYNCYNSDEYSVESVEDAGIAPAVYCCTIPTTHNIMLANGLITGNCAEEPLPPYGACLLGSINLTKYVGKADKIQQDVALATAFLDSVIDLSEFPLEAQKEEALNKRRMGIGVTGFADYLRMCNVPYGSAAAVEIASVLMNTINSSAYMASVELSKEFGEFPALKNSREKYVQSKFLQEALTQDQRNLILTHGIRNSHLTCVAPTGTISLLAGNVSSGIEPIFASEYQRKFIVSGDEKEEYTLMDYACYAEYEKTGKKAVLTDAAHMLSPAEHLNVMQAFQKYCDSSISKTINVPTECSFESFKDIYMDAWTKGLKGCTTYRPNPEVESVLSTTSATDPVPVKKEPHDDVTVIPERPDVLPGSTYRIKDGQGTSYYITINDVIDGDQLRPFEIFINSKAADRAADLITMTRLISAIFRKEKDPTYLCQELINLPDVKGGWWQQGKYIPSLQHLIGTTIQQHIEGLKQKGGFKNRKSKKQSVVSSPDDASEAKPVAKGLMCPQCNGYGLVKSEGCMKCLECGFSKCG